MTSWTKCSAVERSPRKISADLAFTGTRVPVYALFENIESGSTVKGFLEWYLEVKEMAVGRCSKARNRVFNGACRNVKILFDYRTPSPL